MLKRGELCRTRVLGMKKARGGGGQLLNFMLEARYLWTDF